MPQLDVEFIVTGLRAAGRSSRDSSVADEFPIVCELPRGFICTTSDNIPAYVLPVGTLRPLNKSSKNYSLWSAPKARFDVRGRTWETMAVAIRCMNPRLLLTFSHFVQDVETRLSTPAIADAQQVLLDTLSEWASFFAPDRKLAPERALGLWGELWFLSKFQEISACAEEWCGPDGSNCDFFIGGIAIEVKTSLRSLYHQVSQSQSETLRPSLSSFLVSLCVQRDPQNGKTLGDLAKLIFSRLTDGTRFVKLLTNLGFPREDWEQTTDHFGLSEPPHWFRMEDIPRIRDYDEGITRIRYEVSLNPSLKLPIEAVPMQFSNQTHI